MKKATKIWLITAGCLVVAGGIIFTAVMSALNWDFAPLSTAGRETNTYEIAEPFSNISLETDTADIVFALAEDGKCKIVCNEEKNAKHSLAVEEDTLVISVTDKRTWYDHIGFSFAPQKITVYLPETEYHALSIHESTGNVEIPLNFAFWQADISVSTGNVGFFATAKRDLKIKTSTGDIRVENTSVGSLDISTATGRTDLSNITSDGDITVGVTTGKANLSNVFCKNVISSGTTGDISFSDVIAAEEFSAKRSTGNIDFDDCDAAGLYVKTNTGNVTGCLLSDKVFIADTDTGRIDIPKTTLGGKCEITTDTGDIIITIKQH